MTARAVALGLACCLVGAGAARAQPPGGVVRPAGERGMALGQLGAQLFAANCASCHGAGGRGVRTPRPGSGDVSGQGPPLRGVGALAADFELRTGYMPLGRPDEQPSRRRVLFDDREVRALVAYVASLGGGPAIPRPRPAGRPLGRGFELFTEHCAGCHQAVARGGYVTGARVPPLDEATPRQIAEAVRLGPYLMPRFSQRQISHAELEAIIAYVRRAQHPDDRGGWAIGNLGPVPEGLVAWLIGATLLVTACVAIGTRLRS
jgi:ubiquinol-cytochrome c reductase cytochrome c subunit